MRVSGRDGDGPRVGGQERQVRGPERAGGVALVA